MKRVWIQLAKTGDILNILPLLWKDAQDGHKPVIVASHPYHKVLDGCSYVEPVLFHGEPFDIEGAFEFVRSEFANDTEIICTQVNGPTEMVRDLVYKPAGLKTAVTTSYQKEQWRVAGRLGEWDECYPLVFDQRNAVREVELLDSFGLNKRGKAKRLILVATEGVSSPFAHSELLLELLKGRFGRTHQIIPLPQAERFYDLLALYERAEVLVSVDSAPLHLARAVPTLRVVALANDKPILWNGSSWTPNHIAYCRYSDFPARAVELLDAIEVRPAESDVVFVWNAQGQERRRLCTGPWQALPISRGMCGRDASNTLRDEQPVPYLKDCLRMAMQKPGCKFVAISRHDTFLEGVEELSGHEAAYAYRLNRSELGNYTFQPVADFFYASKPWWKEHLSQLPDYLFGRDHFFSHGLWAFFRKHGAVDVTGIARRVEPKIKAEGVLPPLPPRMAHNKTLCDEYVKTAQITCRYPKVTEQIETVASFTHMTRYGYNPSLVEHGGQLYMAYRYHYSETAATRLELATLDNACAITGSHPLNIEGTFGSLEDPKFFHHQGKMCVSWVDSNVPTTPFRSVVRYGVIKSDLSLRDVVQPPFWNTGETIQKNWVLFPSNGTLACIYGSQPEQIVFMLDNNQEFRTPGPTWAYGHIRGGTTPVEFEGKLLRFFHGGLDNEQAVQRRRYYMGALLMEAEPPFKILKVSKKPILYGSEIDDIKVKDRPPFWKSNVVFPGGVVARDGHWLVSLGVNDSSCAIVKVRPENLHL